MDQVLGYFREAQKILEANEFATHEDFELFLQNVFTEIDGKESRLACHHDGSVVLEAFLGEATAFQVRVFFDRITGIMGKLVVHRYGSHVMEALLRRSGTHLADPSAALESEEDEGSKELAGLPQMLLRLSKEVGEQFEAVVRSPQGSHVYRKMVSLFLEHCKAYPLFRDELGLILGNVALSPTAFLRDLAFDGHASPVLQTHLSIASQIGSSSLAEILQVLIGDFSQTEAQQFVYDAASNEFASHLIEAAMKAMDSAAFVLFYRQVLRPQLESLVQGKRSNFAIQQAITTCHNEAQLKGILDDLQQILPHLLVMQRAGLLVRLVQWGVQKKGLCEDAIIPAIFTAFHVKTTLDKKSIVPLCLRLQALEQFSGQRLQQPISSLGCSLLEAVASFKSAESVKLFVDSLLDFEADELEALALHPQGSHVLEAFLKGPAVTPVASRRLVSRLVGKFGHLAADRFASHVVEKAWAVSKVDLKNTIMEELVAAKRRLEDSQHGRLVLRNCKVAQFERRQEDWVMEEAAVERKKALFADILVDDSGKGQSENKRQKKPSDPASKSKTKKSKKSAKAKDGEGDESSLLLTEDA